MTSRTALAVFGMLLFAGCHGGTGDHDCDLATAQAPLTQGPIAPGDFSHFADLQWIDTHVHLRSHRRIDDYVALQDRFGMKRMVLLSTAGGELGGRPNKNAEGLLAKARHPDRFYLFGHLDETPVLAGGEAALRADVEAQVNQLALAGVDGLKFHFTAKRIMAYKAAFGVDYLPDSPTFAGAFRAAAAHRLPVLLHLDPGYLAHGVNAAAIYPNVIWVPTHAAWAQTRVERLENILAASPLTRIDLGHFVHLGELAAAGQPAADFLTANASRVLQSTDLASGCDAWGLDDDSCPSEAMAVSQAWTVRALLETAQPIDFISAYTGKPMRVTGLNLPRAALDGLYRGGALALLGAPKPLNCPAALAQIDRLINHTRLPAEITRLTELRALFVASCP